jgi:hypothetical protein
MDYYAHVRDAIDRVTGPVGSPVRIFTSSDTTAFFEGRLRDRVVMDDRLEAVVVEIEGLPRPDGSLHEEPVPVTVRWGAVESLVQLPDEEAAP